VLFDETHGPGEFRVSLVGAHLWAACEGRLSEMLIEDEALEATNQILGYVRAAAIRKARVTPTSVFIGHGRAPDWNRLREGGGFVTSAHDHGRRAPESVGHAESPAHHAGFRDSLAGHRFHGMAPQFLDEHGTSDL
jgi:hypothetical protein